MADQDDILEELKALVKTQARTFEERLARIEAIRKSTGGWEEVPVGGDQPSCPEGAGTGELAGSASGHRGGVITDSLLPAR